MTSARRLIVAIDGPAGVGKSTAARGLAERLAVPYLDTGAMYRCLALWALESGVDLEDRKAVEACLAEAELELVPRGAKPPELLLGGRLVGDEIRTPAVSLATSKISRYSGVRRQMVELQRAFAERYGGVLEGRDIGTVVVPETPYKFFLDADPAVRARRRQLELERRGAEADPAKVRADLDRRDRQDRSRAESPLRCDASYTVIDTTSLGPEEVIERMLAAIERET